MYNEDEVLGDQFPFVADSFINPSGIWGKSKDTSEEKEE